MKERPVAIFEIDGTEVLTGALIAHINDALDRVEDMGPDAVGILHTRGSVGPAEYVWPGRVNIESVNRWERSLRRLEAIQATTIAFVEGCCTGLALELLLVCDRRLAAPDFSMRCSRVGDGVWPGMSLYRLCRQIGESRARHFSLSATEISASCCLKLDIIDDIVNKCANGTPMTSQLLQYAIPRDFSVRRRLLQESASTSFDEALGAHLAACDRTLRRL